MLQLSEECFQNISQSECCFSVYLVVDGFLGMQKAHTLAAIARDDSFLDFSFYTSCRSCADASIPNFIGASFIS